MLIGPRAAFLVLLRDVEDARHSFGHGFLFTARLELRVLDLAHLLLDPLRADVGLHRAHFELAQERPWVATALSAGSLHVPICCHNRLRLLLRRL